MTFAFLDISRNDSPVGRIVIELNSSLAPKASKNFLELCIGHKEFNGAKLTYKGNIFHRVIKNFMIQGGDIVYGSAQDQPNDKLGTGGASIYAANNSSSGPLAGVFEDENLEALDTSMNVAMANTGKDTNCSQFFINTAPSPHLNGQYTVFGKVIYGKSVAREIEKVDTNADNVPKELIIISECGEWHEGDQVPIFNACYDSIGGDVFEEYPDDETKIGDSTAKAYEATYTIKESATALFKKNEKSKALLKYKKALRYCNEFIPDDETAADYYKKFIDLKKKLFLNLTLTCLKLEDFDESIKYCNFLIEMNDILILSPSEVAKTYYRRGVSFASLKKLDLAFQDITEAKKLAPDDVLIDKEYSGLEKLINDRKLKQKAKYSKFFD